MKIVVQKRRTYALRALLIASSMAFAPAVLAQSADLPAEPPADAPSAEDSSATIVPQSDIARSNSDATAQMALLQAQVEGLQAQLTELKTQLTKATPTWKGAPQWTDADDGWSFKVRGRLMIDGAYTGKPVNYVTNKNLGGFTTRVRRFRIGVEGGLPGGFGYKAEVDYANAAVGFGDVILTYAPANKPFWVQIGNQESLDGMEQQTSSRWSSFIERTQHDDAFGNTRRLGVEAGYRSSDNLFRIDAGMFGAHSIDASLNNSGWIGAVRTTYSPYAMGGFLHFGANWQHRQFQSNDAGAASVSVGSPSTNQFGRYRARPFLQTTDQRFIDTGNIAAKGDDIFGLEVYGVFKSLHIGGEAQLTKVHTYRPGTISTGIDAFTGGSGVTPATDPTFWGGFFEVGYFLTGETRGYKNGLWDRTKVLHPFNKGGWGALQVIGRFDYLDLNSNAVQTASTTNFATGATTAATASNLSRGGSQTGYLLGLTWIPTDYVRFLVNYIHSDVKGGPFQAIANPASTAPLNARNFKTDSLAVRAQLDF